MNTRYIVDVYPDQVTEKRLEGAAFITREMNKYADYEKLSPVGYAERAGAHFGRALSALDFTLGDLDSLEVAIGMLPNSEEDD